jgi:hypothetical protein
MHLSSPTTLGRIPVRSMPLPRKLRTTQLVRRTRLRTTPTARHINTNCLRTIPIVSPHNSSSLRIRNRRIHTDRPRRIRIRTRNRHTVQMRLWETILSSVTLHTEVIKLRTHPKFRLTSWDWPIRLLPPSKLWPVNQTTSRSLHNSRPLAIRVGLYTKERIIRVGLPSMVVPRQPAIVRTDPLDYHHLAEIHHCSLSNRIMLVHHPSNSKFTV